MTYNKPLRKNQTTDVQNERQLQDGAKKFNQMIESQANKNLKMEGMKLNYNIIGGIKSERESPNIETRSRREYTQNK